MGVARATSCRVCGAPRSDAARYRQMGNAVTVNVAEWIGRRIMCVAASARKVAAGQAELWEAATTEEKAQS